jgi:hypothetical protein
MSHLHAAIGKVLQFRLVMRTEQLLPAKLTKVAAMLPGEARTKVPDEQTTRELQERVAAMVKAGLVEQVSRRDLKLSCVTITSSPMPPASNAAVGDILLAAVQRQARRPAFMALLEAYVNTFDPADEKTRWLAKHLAQMVPRWEWRAKDVWKERLDRFALLDVNEAPKRIALEILAAPQRQRQILQEAGLDEGARGQSELALAAFRSACGTVAGLASAKVQNAQAALLAWNKVEQASGRFPTAWLDLCKACLEPWANAEPQQAHRGLLIEHLQRLSGGDPRTSGRDTQWGQVRDHAPTAYNVMMRWLTQVSVKQFLEVVDRSLTEPDARLMWAYRKAFWLSYLDNKNGPKIEQAWVAFGEQAAALARRIATRRETVLLEILACSPKEPNSTLH